MTTVVGVDLSAAKTAGDTCWVTEACLGGGVLRVDRMRPLRALARSAERDAALAGLRGHLAQVGPAAVGIDMPFGLPEPLVEAPTWEAFLQTFPDRYDSPDQMRSALRDRAEGELKRRTDREARTPFSPYNLRVYKQTYHGLVDLLAPLVRDHGARALPMHRPDPGHLWLMEVCPASTLKHEGLYKRYKGAGPDRRRARRAILEALEDRHAILLPSRQLRSRVLADAGGDALDSLVAAHAVARSVGQPHRLRPRGWEQYEPEGYVYV